MSAHGFVRAAGLRLASLGEGWAAFSALSGESHLLSDEAVAVIGVLDADRPLTASQVAQALSVDYDQCASEIEVTLSDSWISLIEAGLVCQAPINLDHRP